MSGQMLLFDALEAVADTHAEWLDEALAAIHRVASRQPELTSDDIWQYIDPPREPRALGAAMVEARRRNWIEPTPMTTRSGRRECHSRPIRIWQSLLYQRRNTHE